MKARQFILPIADELVVDLFAGGGGASTGIEQAIGRHVDIAVNHDPEAVDLHMANHPQTRHFVSDVFEVDPITVTGGRPVGLLWASPDCKHFSKAKGGKPVSKKIRALAWVVIKWAQAVSPRMILLENVEEFATWGPTIAKKDENGRSMRGADGKVVHMPCAKRKGQTFTRWLGQLRKLGYQVEWKQLRACDYGAPTIRKRLFLIARRDGQPIVWPEPTHGAGRQKPWRTAAECIDWSVPAPSIFERTRPLAEATCRRIAKGIMRYVVDAAEPFIVGLAHGEHKERAGSRTHSLHAPMRTIHAGGGNHALVAPTLVQTGYGEREGQSPRALDIGKPLGTIVSGQKHALVSAFLAKHYTGVVGSDMAAPMGTATTVDHHSLVAVTIEKEHGRTSSFQRADQGRASGASPGRDHLEDGAPRQPAARDADRAQARGAKEQGRLPDGQDGMAREGLSAGRAPSRLHSADRAASAGDGCEPPGRRQDQQQPEQHGAGDARGESPACTSDGTSGRIGGDHQGVDHSEEVRAFLTVYYGTDQDPRIDEPLHTVTTKDRFGLVTVHGETYAIADIGMRMLQPRELYRAQGFPDTYIIDRGAAGRILPKSAQVRMCGNSVCPPIAAAMVRANYQERQGMEVAA